MMSPATHATFDSLCRLIAAKGKGLTLAQLGDCAALAQESEADEPDPARVEYFRERLGLSADDIREVAAA